ncbi:MAG: ATP-binding protein, partial [Firmicutes bacterium]|nr:ATP-binding protein [Bacillota bacterium]
TGMVEFGYELMDEHNLSLYVKDTGMGLKENEKNETFNLFYKSPGAIEKDIEGIGIGVNIVYRLAHMLGNEIKLETEYGKGSCYCMKLKRSKTD